MANGGFGLFSTPIEAGTGNQALSGFEQLLGNPLFTGGIGLLAGSLDETTSPGQDLLSALGIASQTVGTRQDQQTQRLKNEAARQELLQRTRQQRARQEVFSRMRGQQVAPGTGQGFGLLTGGEIAERQTPGLDQSDMGLFAEAFPDEVGAGLATSLFDPAEQLVDLGNGVQVPFSDLTIEARNAVAAGNAPGSETFREAVAAASDNDIEEIAATTDILFKQAQIQQLQEERQETQEERRRSKERKEVTIVNSVENTASAIRANNVLEGTALETGAVTGETVRSVMGYFNAARKALGKGDPKLDELNTAFDRFGQLTTKGFIDEAGAFQKAIDSPLTNQKIAILRGDTAGGSQTPDANRAALADRLDLQLDTAQIEGIEVPNASSLRATIPVLKGEISVEQMSDAELRRLDRSLLPRRVRDRVEQLLGNSTTRSRGGSRTTTPSGATVEFLD